jgi:ribulose-5-phosphate 4-epimerase/fuculose-1-phosphate aldolase
MLYESIRQEIVQTALKLEKAGLIYLSAGNISARCSAELIAITPSGVAYEGMSAADIVIIDLQGSPVEGQYKPSSEWRMHTLICRERPDVQAVIHTHAPTALAFAVAGVAIPMIAIESLEIGGPAPVCEYACPGTEATGIAALKALNGPPAVMSVLLRNHGTLSVGASLPAAFKAAYHTEITARIYMMARQIGEPAALTPEQVAEMQAVYGI